MPNTPPKVVIIGGGFGGLAAARRLRRSPVRVTLVDRCNHHLFQPLLYEVATAALSAPDIAAPIRRVLARQRNARVLMASVSGIDTQRRVVATDGGDLPFDFLVVAAGVRHSYFGHEEWAPLAPGLKTVDDALEIRRRFLTAFETAEREPDAAARRATLTFVIVGAGPTGVELAGTMCELARRAICRDFRAIDTTTTRVILVEGRDRVLPTFHEGLSARAQRDLESLGVEVRCNQLVTGIEPGRVAIDGEWLDTGNVFWAAGVEASPLGAALGAELDEAGRVVVEPDLSIADDPGVFVIGDLARVTLPDGDEPVPGVAPAAVQMGRHVGELIDDAARGRAGAAPQRAFTYTDKGMLATIGRGRAVGRIFGMNVTGLPAWLLWALVHIAFLVGFGNRAVVMLRWAWAYIIFSRGARLITGGGGRR